MAALVLSSLLLVGSLLSVTGPVEFETASGVGNIGPIEVHVYVLSNFVVVKLDKTIADGRAFDLVPDQLD